MSRLRVPVALQALLLLAVATAAWWPILHGGILWDDDRFIINSTLMQAPDGISRIWLTDQAPDYYPVTWSMFWVERHLWGVDPRPYHAVNLVLHLIGVLLLWQVLRQLNSLDVQSRDGTVDRVVPQSLTGQPCQLQLKGGWWIAMIFAVHPVTVESAGWIIEGKNTLSFIFYALSLLAWLRSLEGCRPGWRLLCYTAFALALLSKTSGAGLPIVCLALAWWLQDRLRKEDVLHSLPLFALSLAGGLMSIYMQKHQAIGPWNVHPESFVTRLALAGRAWWFYLLKACIPWPMAMVYPRWHVRVLSVVDWLPDLALIAVALLAWRARQPAVLCWMAVVTALLLPVLGFLDISYMRFSLVANHWAYLALPALLALPVSGLARLQPRGLQIAAGLLVVTTFAGITWGRTRLYASDVLLWQDNTRRYPDVPVAWSNLATALEHQDRPADAAAAYEKAIALEPDDPSTRYKHGNALLTLERLDQAVRKYRAAVRLDPRLAEAHNNLGVALQKEADPGNL
ncbi:MAG: tetratricopeptide repeat protein, partial [Candidatus Xenobia bacterium]